jgi:hypothetical protein
LCVSVATPMRTNCNINFIKTLVGLQIQPWQRLHFLVASLEGGAVRGTRMPRKLFEALLVMRPRYATLQARTSDEHYVGHCSLSATYLTSTEFRKYDIIFVVETRLCFRITGFLDFFHHPVFKRLENATFRKVDLFPSSGEGGKDTYWAGSLRKLTSITGLFLRDQTD